MISKLKKIIPQNSNSKWIIICLFVLLLVAGIVLSIFWRTNNDFYRIRNFKNNIEIYSHEIYKEFGGSSRVLVSPVNSIEGERFLMKKFYNKPYKHLVVYLKELDATCRDIKPKEDLNGSFVACDYQDTQSTYLLRSLLAKSKLPRRSFSVLIEVDKDKTVANIIVDIHNRVQEIDILLSLKEEDS